MFTDHGVQEKHIANAVPPEEDCRKVSVRAKTDLKNSKISNQRQIPSSNVHYPKCESGPCGVATFGRSDGLSGRKSCQRATAPLTAHKPRLLTMSTAYTRRLCAPPSTWQIAHVARFLYVACCAWSVSSAEVCGTGCRSRSGSRGSVKSRAEISLRALSDK